MTDPKDPHGVKGAEYILQYLAHLSTDIKGIALLGQVYPDGRTSTTEVIEYLAEPRKGPSRDIRLTEDDGRDAAQIWMDEVTRRLRRAKNRSGKNARMNATAACGGAFRLAGREMQRRLSKRVDGGVTNTGESAAPVSEAYAAQRKKKYGVDEGEVFKASGTLLGNVTGGVLKLHRT